MFKKKHISSVIRSIIIFTLIGGWFGPQATQAVNASGSMPSTSLSEEKTIDISPSFAAETAVLVKDINPGSASSGPFDYAFEHINGTLFLSASDTTNGIELWKSDGTEGGTILVKDIWPGNSGSDPRYLENVNGTLYFSASDENLGRELWKSDGTAAGTILVKDILPNTSGSNPNHLTSMNGVLYFTASDGAHGVELWKSDGTSEGTNLVLDINPGEDGANPENLTEMNGILYFTAEDGTHSNELWKSDGTPAGTVMVKDIFPGIAGSYPEHLTNVNGTLYFSAAGDLNGYNDHELWKSDGTANGTVLVRDIYPGVSPSYPNYLRNVNGTLYFGASDGVHGVELWKSDGTTAGTIMVKDVWPGSQGGLQDFTHIGNTVYFGENDGTNGAELWKSDGTSAGTVMVKDIIPGSGSSVPQEFIAVNDTVYFVANNGTSDFELWKTDGTSDGTILIKDINPEGDSWPDLLFNANGTLFFRANDGVHGSEPWMVIEKIPTTYYVNDDATGTNDGTSWTDAYTDLQDAFSAVSSGDEIWVAAGVYMPGTNQTDTFQLKSGVAVYGGFDGVDDAALTDRDLIANLTILSGDIDNNDDNNNADGNFINETYDDIVGDNSRHVVIGANEATLDGFIVTAGYASPYATGKSGGGMYNDGTSPTVTNVTFSGNLAIYFGAGMYNRDNSPTITNVTFNGNATGAHGGGMYNDNNSPTITNVTFSGNSANNSGGGMYNLQNGSDMIVMNASFTGNSADSGGGIYNSLSSLTVTNATFSHNSAVDSGGGMYSQYSPMIATYITFSNNEANIGGGMSNYFGTSSTTIMNVTFSGNSASYNGGGLYNLSSNGSMVTNVTFNGNSAGHFGGGVYNNSSNPILTDVIFSENTAPNGGGMFNTGPSNPSLTNVTFSANSSSSGGGMYNNKGSSPNLENVTFDGNTAAAGGGMYNDADSSPTLLNVTFTQNAADSGGGMSNSDSSPVLTDVTFSENTASGSGGGMYNYKSSPTLTDVTFNNNSVTSLGPQGGGMHNAVSSSPTLINVTFSANAAVGDGSLGGGMYNDDDSNPNLMNVTFDGNTADTGGGMYNEYSSPTLLNVTFMQNAANSAGGMFNHGSNPVLTNVTFSGNTATTYQAGGMWNSTDSNPILSNVTFSGNSAAYYGGAILNHESVPTIRNSILWNNTQAEGGQIYNETSTPIVSDSVIQGGYTGGTNIITDDPMLGTLTDFGGPGRQAFPLLPGSSAIDTGNETYCPDSDQRGVERPQGDYCDIGALEDDQIGIYFAKPAPTGEENCTSWTNTCTLQSALSLATGGDEIWVAEGTYTPGALRTDTFQLVNGVGLYGGFNGTETTRAERNFATYHTTLSGDIDRDDTPAGNSYHVVTGSGVDNTTILDGFTITAGNADGTYPDYSGGGGMYIVEGNPSITNVTFIGNTAYRGGGMYTDFSSPTLTYITFSENSASNDGGGMYTDFSSPTLTYVTFSENSASNNGGGMYTDISSPILTNVTFSRNSASGSGGGMSNISTSIPPILTNVTFSENTAFRGGGFRSGGTSSPIIRNTIIWGDGSQVTSDGGGGPIVSDSVLSDFFDIGGGTNIITDDPMLGTLTDFGGPGRQVIPLLPGSSAIDTGNETDCPGTDQRGAERPQGAGCDIGAYEYIDTIYPTVSSITRANPLLSPTNAPSVDFTVTFSEAVTGVDETDFSLATTGTISSASVSAVAGSGGSYTVTVDTGSGDGTIRLDLNASGTGIQDLSGNPLNSGFTNGETYIIDKTPPETFLDHAPDNPSNSTGLLFAFRSDVIPAEFECKLDNEEFAICQIPCIYNDLSEGEHTFSVRAVDSAGNVDPTPATYTWWVDATPPDTNIDSQPANPSNTDSPTFEFSSPDSDSTATYKCQLDSGGYANCTTPKTYTGLSDGEHTFEVRAVDEVGNVDTTPATYTWVIDTVPPDTSIDTQPANPSNNSSASFSFSSLDTAATFECQLDSGGYSECTNPKTYTGLSNGEHTFDVRAVDPAGNKDISPASYTWAIEIIAPVVNSITRTATSPTSTASVDFTVTFSESVTGVDATDFSLTTTGLSGVSITSVNGSMNTYLVTANTGSGNGTIRLDLKASGTGIQNLDSTPISGGFTSGEVYAIIKDPSFNDVPTSYWAFSFIETLYYNGITSGCGGGNYCPNRTVTRAEMAIFLLRGMHGASYTPPVAKGDVFNDIPATFWAAAWVEQFYKEGITSGCSKSPMLYCPNRSVTRAEMAIFLLRAKHGSSYSPPAATGGFQDVPVSYWAASWIEQLAREGITSGCGDGNFCPNRSVTRAEMAVFLTRTFNLTMP